MLESVMVPARCQKCGWETRASSIAWLRGYDCGGCGRLGLQFVEEVARRG